MVRGEGETTTNSKPLVTTDGAKGISEAGSILLAQSGPPGLGKLDRWGSPGGKRSTNPLDPPPPPDDDPKPPPRQDPAHPLPKVDYEKQKKEGGIEGKNLNPDKDAPKYPGPPKDQDKWILKRLFKVSPTVDALYDLFLETYTDRSEENKVPGKLRIAELHKGIADKVASVELLGDSELLTQKDRHGLILHPTGIKNPNSVYAVLRDENGIPINVIEYSQVSGKPKYLQQWVFDRQKDEATGGQKTTIYHFREASQTSVGRPKDQNDTMADALVDRTEYLTTGSGSIYQAAAYNNLGQPTVVVDLAKRTMQVRDPNSGKLIPSPFVGAQLSKLSFTSTYLR